MKKVALLFAVTVCSMAVNAQKIDKNEMKQLQAFLSAPAEKDATNAQALKITDVNAPSTWEGVTVENGHITKIDWKGKKLAGALNLQGFKALTSVDVSRNALTSVSVAGDAALTELNVSRNKITNIDVTDVTALVKVSVNNNRLTEFNLTGVDALENLNIAANHLTALDLSYAKSLKTLNCQSNDLESLSVVDCKALKNLYCGYNQLTSLNLSGVDNLQNVNVDDNKITTLIVSGLPRIVIVLNNQIFEFGIHIVYIRLSIGSGDRNSDNEIRMEILTHHVYREIIIDTSVKCQYTVDHYGPVDKGERH